MGGCLYNVQQFIDIYTCSLLTKLLGISIIIYVQCWQLSLCASLCCSLYIWSVKFSMQFQTQTMARGRGEHRLRRLSCIHVCATSIQPLGRLLPWLSDYRTPWAASGYSLTAQLVEYWQCIYTCCVYVDQWLRVQSSRPHLIRDIYI